MTYEEYQEIEKTLVNQICDLRGELSRLKAQYIKENSPLKIGDKIRINQDEGVVDRIELIGESFFYWWRKFKKNGELSLNSQRIINTTGIEKL